MKQIRRFLIPGILALLTCLLGITGSMTAADRIFSDPLYQRPSAVRKDITILGIDEKTIAVYGDPRTWNRDIPAMVVEKLTETSGYEPAVIGFDVLYIGRNDPASDVRFADACNMSGNVVTAANLIFDTEVSGNLNDGLLVRKAVTSVELPYPELQGASTYGFANVPIAEDGYVRAMLTEVTYQDSEIPSFASAVIRMYEERTGNGDLRTFPVKDGFLYSGKSGSYEILSLADFLSGKIDSCAFKDKIVLVGSYAPGAQDAYHVPIEKGRQMFGVEIQANIIEALMEGKTMTPVPVLPYSVLLAIAVFLFCIFLDKTRLREGFLALTVCTGCYAVFCRYQVLHGTELPLLLLPLMLAAAYLIRVIASYVAEYRKRMSITEAFKRYLTPEVVDQLAMDPEVSGKLGGELRDVAVLFVDIRGFTPLSESLPPEQVVEILNRCLSLTTDAILKHGGMLDKFIGDATMGVFNAPYDQEHYVEQAVYAGIDMIRGMESLNRNLLDLCGRTVSVGIGIHCGKAVVGNIGCEFRMDYTAIGDTVNTAARLESRAGNNEILISRDVLDRISLRQSQLEKYL